MALRPSRDASSDKIVQNSGGIVRSRGDEQRTGREMFAVGIERFLSNLDGGAFEFVSQGQK